MNKYDRTTITELGESETRGVPSEIEQPTDCVACQDIAGLAASDWKARAEKAEAKLNLVLEILDECDECPINYGHLAPFWCDLQCIDIDSNDYECSFHIYDCWRKWLAQEVVKGEDVAK